MSTSNEKLSVKISLESPLKLDGNTLPFPPKFANYISRTTSCKTPRNASEVNILDTKPDVNLSGVFSEINDLATQTSIHPKYNSRKKKFTFDITTK
mmetsp:Transcript_59662/g.73056  ORF Transcript_59662/g.73056 Transcript_59662/m.73056 type:complete len:96 (-) Transcript_59662:36-323(-)